MARFGQKNGALQKKKAELMKTVEVVAAIIRRDERILATQRGYGDFAGGWEFPGGKVEPGETPEQAIVREIREELAAEISVESFLVHVGYDYDTFRLEMDCFVCSLVDEGISLLEHSAARWLGADELDAVDWLPADLDVVAAIRRQHVIAPADCASALTPADCVSAPAPGPASGDSPSAQDAE